VSGLRDADPEGGEVMAFRLWRRPVDPIDALIAERGVAKDADGKLQHRYAGHDDSLRVRSNARRVEAEQIQSAALKVRTRDDVLTRMRRVK
jgi:hypothetical protein